MNRILLIFLFLVGFLFWNAKQKQDESAARIYYARHTSSEENSCTGKKFCIVVYVAPWCSACKSMAPFFKKALIKARSISDYGMKIYVGGSSPALNEKEAVELGVGAVADQDGSIMKKLNVREFPSFFILDKEQTVILDRNEAYQWMMEKIL